MTTTTLLPPPAAPTVPAAPPRSSLPDAGASPAPPPILTALPERQMDPNVGGGVDRDKLPAADFAGKNRSYPIATPGDVQDAAASIGRAGSDNYSSEELRRRIIAIARRKGASFVARLPKAWRDEEEESAGAPLLRGWERRWTDALDREALAEAQSYQQRLQAVAHALHQRFGQPGMQGMDYEQCAWPEATYDGSVVYRRLGGLWRLGYTVDEGGAVTLADSAPQAQQVEYVAAAAAAEVGAAAESAESAAAPTAGATPGAPAAVPSGRRTLVLCESVRVQETDAAAGVLTVQVIQPGWSTNGRYYPAETLAASAPLLDNTRAFADHPLRGDRPERSIRDQIGYYRNPRIGAGGALEAELQLVGASDLKQHILDWAQESITRGESLMGLSINAVGQVEEGEADGRTGKIVAEIAAYDSVDIVTRPAAGGRFQQIAAADDADTLTRALLDALSYEAWRDARPAFREQLCRYAVATATPAAVLDAATVQGELSRLQEAVAQVGSALAATQDRLAAYELDERAESALAQAGVPFVFRAPLRAQLLVLPEASWGAFLVAQAHLQSLQAQAVPQPRGAGPLAPLPRAAAYTLPVATDGMNFREWQEARHRLSG